MGNSNVLATVNPADFRSAVKVSWAEHLLLGRAGRSNQFGR
jgi:hypothetical protein